jgi:hypothetical protein
MISRPKNSFAKSAAAALLAGSMFASSSLADTNDNSPKVSFQQIAVQSDYVTNCHSNSCAPREAVGWSKEPVNKNSVAVAVRMGTANQLPDYQIKQILSDTLRNAGVQYVKFFFEQNDIENTGRTYHVRGGTIGPFALNKEAINEALMAARLANYEHLQASVDHSKPQLVVD